MLGWDDDILDAYMDEPECRKENALEIVNNIVNTEECVKEADYFELIETDSKALPVEQMQILSEEKPVCIAKVDELLCFGCGFKSHFKDSTNHCHFPLIYHFAKPFSSKRARKQYHAPWYCNACISCSFCRTRQASKYVACRRCGKSVCLDCYRGGRVNGHTFANLSNFVCNDCVECVNCGWWAPKGIPANFYADNTLCQPCFLSRQLDSVCPLCNQIYHNLPNSSDFGDVDLDSAFSLCPMIECDGCRQWVHCKCEEIDEEEYEMMGQSKTLKFYCSKCREPEDTKETEDVEEELLEPRTKLKIGTSFKFRFFDPTNPWQECSFYLKFLNSHFHLRSDGEMRRIKAETLTELIAEFKEMFQDLPILNWSEAIRIERFLTPTRLISCIPKHLTELRRAIESLLPTECARTTGYFKRMPRSPQITKLIKQAKTQASSKSKDVKVPSKILYINYLNALKQDRTYLYTEATSLGLALRRSKIAGFGLFATKAFASGDLIIEYCGELLKSEEMVNRRDQMYSLMGARFSKSCYLFRLDENRVLDATLKGNLSRFINHSCDPNCFSRTVSFEGKNKKLFIFALKVIEPGEEIVFDYKFPLEDGEKIPCYCGSIKCRRFMN